MSISQSGGTPTSVVRAANPPGALFGALFLGVPLAAFLLYVIHFGPVRETFLFRYFSHPIEGVEVAMFCLALGALSFKLVRQVTERRGCRAKALPAWNGQPVPLSEAGALLEAVQRQPRALRSTYLVRRVENVLDFVRRRGSVAELDDQLRTLTDNDALALETSYALTRFITWAIPILGFLGTVLGITGAISGVTPEVLEKSLGTVTDGLSLAFDATALALALTMTAMFLSFLLERAEQGVLDRVEAYVDEHLAHRFERVGIESGAFTDVVRHYSQHVLKTCDELVHRQAEIWAKTFADLDQRRAEAERSWQARLSATLESALEKTLQSHAQHLAVVEKQTLQQTNAVLEKLTGLAAAVRESAREQQSALTQVAQAVTAQVSAVRQLHDDEKQLFSLQDALNQNLTVLAGSGTLEQAVHSLTAAIHLLTAKAAATPASPASRSGPRPGVAA